MTMVTMIQPAGFAVGVFTTSVVLATLDGRRFGGFRAAARGLVPSPVREQRIASVRR